MCREELINMLNELDIEHGFKLEMTDIEWQYESEKLAMLAEEVLKGSFR